MPKSLYLFKRKKSRTDYSGIWTLDELNYFRETDITFNLSELKHASYIIQNDIKKIVISREVVSNGLFSNITQDGEGIVSIGNVNDYSISFYVNDTGTTNTAYSNIEQTPDSIISTSMVPNHSYITNGTEKQISQTAAVPQFETKTSTISFNVLHTTHTLLHFDGADGGTIFTDSVGGVPWNVYGGVTTSITQKKFGNTSYKNLSNGWIYVDSKNMNTLVERTFTFECWIYLLSFNGDDSINGSSGLFSICDWGNYNGVGLYISKTKLQLDTAGVSIASGVHNMAINNWYHIAWVRSDLNHKLFVNGTMVANIDSNIPVIFRPYHFIGSISTGTAFNGYMDECRISRKALYTGSFSPSASAYTI